jgi:hypothetical protein
MPGEVHLVGAVDLLVERLEPCARPIAESAGRTRSAMASMNRGCIRLIVLGRDSCGV